jgi:hypothetical protein
MAKAATKKKDTGRINLNSRPKKAKSTRSPLFLDEKYTGTEPTWEGWEKWSETKFLNEKRRGMNYYNYFNTYNDLSANLYKWMEKSGYTKEDVRCVKEIPDSHMTITSAALATMFLRGMPESRDDIEDYNPTAWMKGNIAEYIIKGRALLDQRVISDKNSVGIHQPSIQERIREATYVHLEEIEDWLEGFIKDPASFDPKGFNVLTHFKTREINQAHARLIRDKYAYSKQDYDELLSSTKDKTDAYTQLVDGYSCYTKAQQKNMQAALTEIIAACDMILQKAKVSRKIRAKKAPSKEKLVAKLKFKPSDDQYKLVSIKPEEALQSIELWVFNTRTRKLGVYVAGDTAALSIKGTTIINYSETKSVARTVRKPEEFFRDVKSLPKTKLRKLFEGINGVETKLNGRLNEDVVILKAYT